MLDSHASLTMGHFRSAACILGAGWFALLLATTAAAQEIRLTLAHGAASRSVAHGLLLKPWVQGLAGASNNGLRIAIEPAKGDAALPSRLFERLIAGEVDLVWAPVAGLPGGFPEAEVFELPFMAWPAVPVSRAAQSLRRDLEPAGGQPLLALLFHADAPVWLHMAKAPVRRLEDLRGKRLYAPTRFLRRFLKQAGAETVGPEPRGTVALLLKQGRLDGAVLSFAQADTAGVLDTTRFHTRFDRPPEASRARQPGIGTTLYALAINGARFRALPEDLRALIAQSVAGIRAESAGRTWDSLDRLKRREATGAGRVFYQLSAPEARRWRQAARPVIDAWTTETGVPGRDGKALLLEARSLIARFVVEVAEELEARTRPTREKGG